MFNPQEILTLTRASKEFKNKPPQLQRLINEALYILYKLGIPVDGTPRRIERMALAFLAVADVRSSHDWENAKDITQLPFLKTRDIINYVNLHFNEKISLGSYDDIRRQDLLLPVTAGIIVQTSPNSARNDPTRAYALRPEYASIIRQFGSSDWGKQVELFLKGASVLANELAGQRNLTTIEVKIASDRTLAFSPGKHNELQKAIIDIFLPRYGYGAEVLYVGDTAHKFLLLEAERLKQLKFFALDHGELPDIVAFSTVKNWLYLIEAVVTSGPISPLRLRKLKQLTSECRVPIIYVTAFQNRTTFRKFIADIAWETEVWIAEEPDHLIHFDGEKFLGSISEGD